MDDNANKRMLSPERGSSDMKMRSEGQGLFIPNAVTYPRGHRGAPTPILTSSQFSVFIIEVMVDSMGPRSNPFLTPPHHKLGNP